MAQLMSSLALLVQAHAFSCLALCYLLLVLLGGVVFTVLEKPVEEELRGEVKDLQRSFLQENPCVEESRLSELLAKTLSAHHRHVAVLKVDADETQCDFASSLYFIIVTLTTMGSDTYSPQSDEAKLFCIFYCALGIPFTLLLLSLLSNHLLHVVTHVPVQHLNTHYCLPHPRAALIHASLLSLLLLLLLVLPALLVCMLEPDHSFLDAIFSCFVILSTVGQGQSSVGESWGPQARDMLQFFTTCYLLVGLVVIITFKDTVLLVPQVRVVMRLLSGLQCADLEGVGINELTISEDSCEEEPHYFQSICTISSIPLELMSPCPDLQRPRTLTPPHSWT